MILFGGREAARNACARKGWGDEEWDEGRNPPPRAPRKEGGLGPGAGAAGAKAALQRSDVQWGSGYGGGCA